LTPTLKTLPLVLLPPSLVMPYKVVPLSVKSPQAFAPGYAPPAPVKENRFVKVCALAWPATNENKINTPSRASRRRAFDLLTGTRKPSKLAIKPRIGYLFSK